MVLRGLKSAALIKRGAGPWILALPRPDLDPSSKVPTIGTSHVTYKLNAKENQVAVMHVLTTGPGRVRLGYREHIPVSCGDLCLVNLREAGHWISLGIGGGVENLYLFTADVPFAKMYRTGKPSHAPQQFVGEPDAEFRARRDGWNDAWLWNIAEVLSDYVLLGRDPVAEKKMRNGEGTRLHIPGTTQTDGVRSDDHRDNRFPIVYRRILGVGPGRWMTRESDLGVVEREETKCEARPGDMMAMCKSVQAAGFTFQGAPLEVIHAASVLVFEGAAGEAGAGFAGSDQGSLDVHESVPKPLTWDEPNEDEEVDPEPPPEAV